MEIQTLVLEVAVAAKEQRVALVVLESSSFATRQLGQ
jgi:hypothetical protein